MGREEMMMIDFDEEVEEEKKEEGLLPVIGFEENGEAIFKLSELVAPRSGAQRKYLEGVNERILKTGGNLRLVETILYPERHYFKQQRRKQEYQRQLDEKVKKEEQRVAEALPRYKERLKHTSLKESNPELYLFITKNPDPKVYQTLKRKKIMKVAAPRAATPLSLPVRKKYKAEGVGGLSSVEYRNETLDALCLGLTSFKELA